MGVKSREAELVGTQGVEGGFRRRLGGCCKSWGLSRNLKDGQDLGSNRGLSWGGCKAGRTVGGAECTLTAQWLRGQSRGGRGSGRRDAGAEAQDQSDRGPATVQEESPQPVTFTCWAGSGAPKARRPGFGQRREHRVRGWGASSGHVDVVIPASGRDPAGSSPELRCMADVKTVAPSAFA